MSRSFIEQTIHTNAGTKARLLNYRFPGSMRRSVKERLLFSCGDWCSMADTAFLAETRTGKGCRCRDYNRDNDKDQDRD